MSLKLKLMPIPHELHMNEIIPTSRRTKNTCGGHMFTGGPDVRNSHASKATLTMAENHIKTDSIGLGCKLNIVMSRRTYHKHDPAPVSLCNRTTTASHYISDHKNRGQKKPGKRR